MERREKLFVFVYLRMSADAHALCGLPGLKGRSADVITNIDPGRRAGQNRKEGGEYGSLRVFGSQIREQVTVSGLAGTTRLPSTQFLDECITQPLPEEGQVPVEAPLVSACTFYILYEASSVPSFIFTLVHLKKKAV